ncbi:uncharacterized protein [Oryza sativa Japonica Group]|uniref:Expressed protein n=2 Tax=Oryza sativa subsp. japonica TaxID=39947 RepID=Q337N4_ORYSJ|nr:uncharacterized protein LOC4348806 [Oryza sativa Japonica Group]ABB47756.1 expressed protein [Oryza sativa Japonica Group]KAF2913876.1 hypothetical protein DAI22_10g120200 [Oryza sativa Japonica Group]BAF26680.1 Os10g0458300 [Oryza sativa Japonica Group]BAG98880.1 unnamed protein product [Oryza sativa Japonica Group]BAT11149.1 Os10g0458300 [Oryza sativa Japonica Group]|eukprot:NP_001064766.1 Os10g0458300 [Oryza sativa Japonica Group]
MAAVASSAEVHEGTRSCVLLNVRGYRAARRDATTATSYTSNGHPIEVSFRAALPPVLSDFYVYCPALQLQEPADYPSMVPKAIAVDGDLFLFRIPIDRVGTMSLTHNDYFVYMARSPPHRPRLDLLPNPSHDTLGDKEIAILSCADGGEQYVVTALRTIPGSKTIHRLHLYRSKPNGEQGRWTSQMVSVEGPLMRDLVCPIPETVHRQVHHVTSKVIRLGTGANGMVGWVDIWRGILLCDVLQESPKLHDMPLPLPAKSNSHRAFLNTTDQYCGDVAVSRDKSFIKYVEMEIVTPKIVSATPPGDCDPDPFLEWLRRRECKDLKRTLVHGRWKATTWRMPIPVTSWDDWCRDCAVESAELSTDNPKAYELLCAVSKESLKEDDDDKAMEAATTTTTRLPLGRLGMAYPAMSIDDDVIYVLTKPVMGNGKAAFLTAVDVRRKKVLAVAKLDSAVFMRYYLAVGISKHFFSAPGTRESLGQAEDHGQKSARRRRRRRGKRQE